MTCLNLLNVYVLAVSVFLLLCSLLVNSRREIVAAWEQSVSEPGTLLMNLQERLDWILYCYRSLSDEQNYTRINVVKI